MNEIRRGKNRDRRSHADEHRLDRRPVLINPLRACTDNLNQRTERLEQNVLHHRPDLREGIRHSAELCVDFIRRAKHGVFNNLRRDLALGSHSPNLANRYAEVIGNRLNDRRRLLKDTVELFTSQHAGGHSLGQLHHCSLLTGHRSACNRELLIDKLCKGDKLVCIVKGVFCHDTHLRNGVSRALIGGAGPVCGGHDLVLQRRSLFKVAGNQVQPCLGLRHGVRKADNVLDRQRSADRRSRVHELRLHGLRRAAGSARLVLDFFKLRAHPSKLFTCRLEGAGIDCAPRSGLHGLKAV